MNLVLRNLKTKRIEAEVKIVNMVMLMCGAQQDCIPDKVDLDALNADEVHELLEEHLTDLDVKYPLAKKSKSKATNLRMRYAHFFVTLTEKLLSGVNWDSSADSSTLSRNKFSSATGGNDLQVLQVLVDQLVTLSGYAIMNIRDGASEAAAAVGKVIAIDIVKRREESLTQRRLMEAEGAKGKSGRASARFKHLQTSIAGMESTLRSLDELTRTIFDGCLVTRYKDVHASIRRAVILHMDRWIRIDAEKYMRDEYLKYIGWSLSDPKAEVRIAAVEALTEVMQSKDYVGRMQSFTDRFADKLSTLAAFDASKVMNLEAVLLLQKLDSEGLLDLCSEEVLDRVDRMVFDADITETCRSEAGTTGKGPRPASPSDGLSVHVEDHRARG